jgi:hypothetical protein
LVALLAGRTPTLLRCPSFRQRLYTRKKELLIVSLGLSFGACRCACGANQLFSFGPVGGQDLPTGIWRASIDGKRIAYTAPVGRTSFPPAGLAYNPSDSVVYWSRHYTLLDDRGLSVDLSKTSAYLDMTTTGIPTTQCETCTELTSMQRQDSSTGLITTTASFAPISVIRVTGSKFVGDVVYAGGVALDTTSRKIYWTEFGGGERSPAIRRADFDGTNVETRLPSRADGVRLSARPLPASRLLESAPAGPSRQRGCPMLHNAPLLSQSSNRGAHCRRAICCGGRTM